MRRIAHLLLQPPQLGTQLRDDSRIGGIVVDIVKLMGVLLKVEQLPFRRPRRVDRAGLSERVSIVIDQLVA